MSVAMHEHICEVAAEPNDKLASFISKKEKVENLCFTRHKQHNYIYYLLTTIVLSKLKKLSPYYTM
jgi:hypothetical protein